MSGTRLRMPASIARRRNRIRCETTYRDVVGVEVEPVRIEGQHHVRPPSSNGRDQLRANPVDARFGQALVAEVEELDVCDAEHTRRFGELLRSGSPHVLGRAADLLASRLAGIAPRGTHEDDVNSTGAAPASQTGAAEALVVGVRKAEKHCHGRVDRSRT